MSYKATAPGERGYQTEKHTGEPMGYETGRCPQFAAARLVKPRPMVSLPAPGIKVVRAPHVPAPAYAGFKSGRMPGWRNRVIPGGTQLGALDLPNWSIPLLALAGAYALYKWRG